MVSSPIIKFQNSCVISTYIVSTLIIFRHFSDSKCLILGPLPMQTLEKAYTLIKFGCCHLFTSRVLFWLQRHVPFWLYHYKIFFF